MQKKRRLTQVGEEIHAANAAWSFGGEVAEVFDTHVRRSVPLYEQGHELCCRLSDFFVRTDSTCYEIGTSTGELLHKLAKHNEHKPTVHWIGVDPEEAMVAKATEKLRDFSNVEIRAEDATLMHLEPCDLVVAYYTVQFMPPKVRQDFINKVYQALNWGGGFLLFEKVRAPDARFQDMMASIYMDFKTDQGYTSDEIMAKARSLKGILEPFSTQGNLDLLKRAGFVDITVVMKYVCFEGFLAIK